jgi:hypothetical protein
MHQTGNPNDGKQPKDKVFFRGGFWWISLGAAILSGVGVLLSRVFETQAAQYTFISQSVLNVLIIAAIAVQALIYRRQWDSMQDSLHQTEKSSIYAQRAYVVAKINDIGKYDDLFQFGLRIENAGNTPANDVIVHYGYGLREKPPHQDASDIGSETERLGLISPNGGNHVLNTPTVPIPYPITTPEHKQFTSGWESETLKFYCWGRITYEDIFNEKRRTDFCFFHSRKHPYGYACELGNEAY